MSELFVISTEQLNRRRDEWRQHMANFQAQLQEIHAQATKLQQQAERIREEMKVIDGAIQAADVFIKDAHDGLDITSELAAEPTLWDELSPEDQAAAHARAAQIEGLALVPPAQDVAHA